MDISDEAKFFATQSQKYERDGHLGIIRSVQIAWRRWSLGLIFYLHVDGVACQYNLKVSHLPHL